MRDYCDIDIFEARCPRGEVILMQEATYGRMELGTCLTIDVGFMGCFRWVFAAQKFLHVGLCSSNTNILKLAWWCKLMLTTWVFSATFYLIWIAGVLVERHVMFQWHSWCIWQILAQTKWGAIFRRALPAYLVSWLWISTSKDCVYRKMNIKFPQILH